MNILTLALALRIVSKVVWQQSATQHDILLLSPPRGRKYAHRERERESYSLFYIDVDSRCALLSAEGCTLDASRYMFTHVHQSHSGL